MAKKKRNYRREYDTYHAKPGQKKARASRNAARRKLKKTGAVRKGDGKEVDHKNGDPRDNRRKNLRAVSRRVNRKKG
tara:strand:+ start:198 stop:428 length:231 start_codon:yes stop_codon:yes gene_type:complete